MAWWPGHRWCSGRQRLTRARKDLARTRRGCRNRPRRRGRRATRCCRNGRGQRYCRRPCLRRLGRFRFHVCRLVFDRFCLDGPRLRRSRLRRLRHYGLRFRNRRTPLERRTHRRRKRQRWRACSTVPQRWLNRCPPPHQRRAQRQCAWTESFVLLFFFGRFFPCVSQSCSGPVHIHGTARRHRDFTDHHRCRSTCLRSRIRLCL